MRNSGHRWVWLSLSIWGLSACSVGPTYVRETPAAPEQFVRAEDGISSAPLQELQFWQGFGDPLLAQLVDQTLQANHDLRIAAARYDQARALLGSSRQEWLPDVGVRAQAFDERSSAAQMPGVPRADRDSRFYDAGLEAVWELDLFGRFRRAVAVRRAEAEASAAELAAAQVALVGQLASSYFQLRGLQAQLQVAESSANNQGEALTLVRARQREGRSTDFDVARAEALLQTTLALIPALASEIAVAEHRIALLTGQAPDSLIAQLRAPATLPELPGQIAVGVPAELLHRRPDILAAERRLAAATERVGYVTTDLFPRLTLTGLIGSHALTTGDLFGRDSETHLFGVGVHWPLAELGRVRARIAAADAGALEHLVRYEQTLLTALEETESALVRYSHSQRQRDHLQAASAAGQQASQLARLRYEGGAADFLQVLDAERSQLDIDDRLVRSKTQAALAMVDIYRALAGGWSAQPATEIALSETR